MNIINFSHKKIKKVELKMNTNLCELIKNEKVKQEVLSLSSSELNAQLRGWYDALIENVKGLKEAGVLNSEEAYIIMLDAINDLTLGWAKSDDDFKKYLAKNKEILLSSISSIQNILINQEEFINAIEYAESMMKRDLEASTGEESLNLDVVQDLSMEYITDYAYPMFEESISTN